MRLEWELDFGVRLCNSEITLIESNNPHDSGENERSIETPSSTIAVLKKSLYEQLKL